MKKLFITVAVITALGTVSAEAKPNKKQDTKITAAFTQDFIGAKDVNWTSDGDFVYAHFTLNGSGTTAAYDKLTGEFTGYVQLLDADHAPSFVRNFISIRYNGFSIIGNIAESADADNVTYIFTIENSKQIIKIKADTNGSTSVLSKINKA